MTHTDLSHQSAFHTFTIEGSVRSGTLYLSPARKAWKRRNELLDEPQPILLFDISTWRAQRETDALTWSESTIGYQLSHHALTAIEVPTIDWLAPFRGPTQTFRSQVSSARSSTQLAFNSTTKTIAQNASSSLNTAVETLTTIINVPRVVTQATLQATKHSAEWLWGVGEATLHVLGELTPSRSTLHTLSRWSSHVTLSFAVALLLLFAGPVVVLQTQDFISKANLSMPHVQLPFGSPDAPEIPSPSPSPLPEITSAEDVFSIHIPDLNIKSTITANVDPGNEKEYSSALKKGIAHAAGTALPEQTEYTKTMYLFAHSTDAPWNIARYNAQFYALKDAQPGQLIHLRFWGKDYTYQIETTEVVAATDITHLQPQFDQDRLVLQTCYPPGTTWKRLVVIATPVQNDGSIQREDATTVHESGPDKDVL